MGGMPGGMGGMFGGMGGMPGGDFGGASFGAPGMADVTFALPATLHRPNSRGMNQLMIAGSARSCSSCSAGGSTVDMIWCAAT